MAQLVECIVCDEKITTTLYPDLEEHSICDYCLHSAMISFYPPIQPTKEKGKDAKK